jgi:hypothetical protein
MNCFALDTFNVLTAIVSKAAVLGLAVAMLMSGAPLLPLEANAASGADGANAAIATERKKIKTALLMFIP